MKGKNLAIKGHPTRGKEIIEILEMLGGNNKFFLDGTKELFYYYIGLDNNIYTGDDLTNIIIFSLEEFLEKYPYKVGNMVKYKGSTSWRFIYKIKKMIWKDNQINYIVYNPWQENNKCTFTAEDLQPYKEEIKAEDRLEIHTDPAIDNNSKTAIDIFVSNESLGLKNGYIANKVEIKDCGILLKCVKNKPQYPKTYKECCKVLGLDTMANDAQGYKAYDIIRFQELLIARDAYWKIAGEEMGLSEPWKPDLTDVKQDKYAITNVCNKIQFELYGTYNGVLVFPTEEMRDAFYENFKDTIEQCKEFL